MVPARLLCTAALALFACDTSDAARYGSTPPSQSIQAASGTCPRERALDLELPTWDLYVSDDAWDTLHVDVTTDVTVEALLCVSGRAYTIDLELQGASSRKQRKKSFDLKFPRERPLDEAPFGEREPLRRILLKAMAIDQSLVREALAFEAWSALGHAAPRVGFTNLRINGAYWGLYNLVEPLNADFLARHGYPEGGTLYKGVRSKQGRADFKPGRDLHTCFEDKSEQETDDWPDLNALATKLQRTPLRYDSFMSQIDSVFPLAPFIDRMIWIAVTQNGDAIAQNFFLYNTPVAGRDSWAMFPWDSNVAFSNHWADPDIVVPAEEALLVRDGTYFGSRLLQVEELRAQFIARFRALLDGELAPERMLERATRLFDLVRHDLAADQERWGRKMAPDDAFAVIESFLDARPDLLRAEMDALEEPDAED